MKKQRRALIDDERGIASIVISIFVILILSLIVLDMSRDSSREQRQALDRQLSSQAFYAAESGINDAVRYITQANDPVVEKENCDPLQGQNQIPGFSSALSETISYTCVMFQTRLDSLEYSNVSTSKSQIIPLEVEGGTLGDIEVSWRASEEEMQGRTNTIFSGCGTFFNTTTGTRFPPATQYPNNCDAGFLRVEIVDATGNVNRTSLVNNTFIAFFAPRRGGTLPSVALTDGRNNNQGIVREAQCNDGGKCRIKITGLNLSPGERMYMRVSGVYKNPDNLSINDATVSSPSGSQDIRFVNAQILVDVTGKATDVLKRLQVRVPLGANATQEEEFRFPEFAIQADTICKQLQLLPPLPPGEGTTINNCN